MLRVKLYSPSWKFTLRAIAAITWLASLLWLLYSPGFEALLAFLGGVSLFLGSFAASDIPKEVSKEIESKLSSSDNIFVWHSTNRDSYGLPKGLPSTPHLYISRPQFEKGLFEALKKYQIVSLEGLSGIGKTDIAIKVLNEIIQKSKSKKEKCQIIFFDNQPEISILNSLLYNASGQDNIRSVLNYFEKENSILVIDNFKILTTGYHQLLENILKYTKNLKVLFISRTRNDWVFLDYPDSFTQVIINNGFDENQARQFITTALRGQKFRMSDDEFIKIYRSSGFGIPRALANYIATLRKSLGNINYFDFFEFEKPEIALKNSAKNLLSLLQKTEIGLIVCMSIVRTPIEKDRLVLLYNHLYPLRTFFIWRKEAAVLKIIKKLTDEYVIDLHNKSTVKVHDSIREAISQFPNQTIKAHKNIARFYISPYQIRPYNPDTVSAKELTDKWNAIYHSVMGRMYEEAANILSEIHPFLSQFGLQEGADLYLEELFRVLKFKVPWIAFLFAYRMFEKGLINEAYEIVDEIIKQKNDERFKLRVLTLKAEILIKLGKEIEALAIAESNVRILENVIEAEKDLIYDSNLDTVLAWNLRILATEYAIEGKTKKSEAYAEKASEIITNIPLKREIAKARNTPGIPLFTSPSEEDVEEDVYEETEEYAPAQKRKWGARILLYLIPLLCLGSFIFIKYDENRLRKLYDEREKAFTSILANIQDVCSPTSISRAIDEISNGSETSYRTGNILIYDVTLEKISILHHHSLPDDLRAQTPSDIGTVFCFWERKVEVGIYRNPEGLIFGRSLQIVWNIIGFDWNTGDLIASTVLIGGEPPSQGVGQGDRVGAQPSTNELEKWIIALPDR